MEISEPQIELTGLNGEVEFGISVFVQFLLATVELVFPTLVLWMKWDMMAERKRDLFNRPDQDYDFIVVGSGSAGSIVASRLSESFKVLLLEAGGTPSFILSMPILTYLMHGADPVDWKWQTVPQTHSSFGLNNNVNFWPGGKALGGSTNINGVLAIRGNVQGFDTVANLTGNPIWGMENMLKIFKKQEDYHGYFDSGDHGKGGFMSVEQVEMDIVAQKFLKAGVELGYNIRDPNAFGPITDGFAPMSLYVERGRRWSAYHHYLKKIIRNRPNLTVRKYATATRVLIDDNNIAFGVEYFQHGKYHTAKCSKEVILSAGAIATPKLLMLSGIGPRTELKNHDITVKVDLPVGQKLQDKYGAVVGPFVSDPNTSFLLNRDFNGSTLLAWVINGTGPIKTSGSQAGYTLSSSFAEKGFPDLDAYLVPLSVDSISRRIIFSQAFNFKPEIRKFYGKTEGQDSFFQLIAINHVTGTGTVRLRNKDPFSKPLIDPKYLQNERDVKILIEGIKLSMTIVEKTKSFQSINSRLFSEPLPGCEKHEFRSDAYWECYARTMTISTYKYSGTVPMGRDRSDPDAVVDPELRVFGIGGLRVIDASVLQVRQLSVNHASVQGTAEAASQVILKNWKNL